MSMTLVDLVGSPSGPTSVTFLARSSSVPKSLRGLRRPFLYRGPCFRGRPGRAMTYYMLCFHGQINIHTNKYNNGETNQLRQVLSPPKIDVTPPYYCMKSIYYKFCQFCQYPPSDS